MEIPVEAKICPHCRKTLGTSLITKVIAGFFALFILVYIIQGLQGTNKKSPTPQTKQQSEQQSAMQKERLAFIQKLVDQGVFQKREIDRTLPHLWVTPRFYALDFDIKK